MDIERRICMNIARAATSWSPTFPMKKEVDRKTAKTCRAAMMIARNKDLIPSDALAQACEINGVYEDDILNTILPLESV